MKPLYSPIVQGLSNYRDENILRFHMPGHYGRSSFPELKYLAENIFNFDITEVEGTDNLNDPHEMILHSLNEISQIYSSKKSYVLVNGSTSGLYVAIDTLVDNNSHVIAARNCHKSVHSILGRKNVNVHYIYPEIDEIFHNDSHIDSEKLIAMADALLAEGITDISAVILTCPNYFGRTFNLKDISDYLSSKNIFLIVDEAHGAHFPFNECLPENAISQGASISIQSAHKTLPALTQACMIHLGHDFPKSRMERLEKNINFYQTSSPSYILMASCETSVAIMARYGNDRLNNIKIWMESAKKKLSANPHIKVYSSSHCNNDQDFCKLGIKTPIKGSVLEKILRQEYKIQCEMSTGFNVLFMIGLTHTQDDIIRLVKSIEALLKNNELLFDDSFESDFGLLYPKTENVKNYILNKGENNEHLLIISKNVSDLDEDICAEEIIPYPPGIPLLMPYEKINKDIVKALKYHEFSEIKCFVTV
ncbi:aminotransferase class I/II-fold pyridoxal phosphate-dependent enzyme [Proteocatella sphenisci]|uniref:aminotransferase class I/II-fold pyridoxal phosphate-dependent enzyme n=1 Tax=Proteocatella sphenisci TaxID=181070 RepID=UPI00048B11A2|nr:aminotransferase class I/II-fold pyridoxal phosphate-dependent enzyme [Proteocatella sphenisci]